MRASLKTLAQEKKKAQRKAKALKEKAQKISLPDMMQMMMMKAFILSEEQRESSGSSSSSSSTEPWKPKNVKEAFQKICEVSFCKEQGEVTTFANLLREEASP